MVDTSISTVEKLDGTNYMTWSFKIKILLKSKGWLKVLTENPPAEVAELEDWNKMDADVMNVIVQTITAKETIYVLNENTAKAAWNKLAERYQGNISDRKIEIQRNLSNIKWKRGDTAEKYIMEIEKLGATLSSLGQSLTEAELSSYALNGLPNHYRCVKRVYEAMRPTEITLRQIRNSLIAEEEIENEKDVNAYKVRQNKRACFYCGKTNHLQKDCWLLNNKSKRNFSTNNKRGNERQKFGKQENRENRPEIYRKANKVHEERSAIHFAYFGRTDEGKGDKKINWTIDSGATCHMTNNKDILEDYVKQDCGNVTIADGTRKEAIGIGNVTFKCKDFTSNMKIENVLYVPKLNDCLLSINKLDEIGMTIQFKNGKCEIIEDNEIKFIGKNKNGLYVLEMDVPQNKIQMVKVDINDNLWHRRFAHSNHDNLYKMCKNGLIRGLKIDKKENTICETCIKGKSTRESFRSVNRPLKKNLLELLHVDTFGPIYPQSLGNSKYGLCIVDDKSRKIKVCFTKSKGEIVESLINSIVRMENETGKKVKNIRSDNGKEFVNRTLEKFFEDKGIKHETTVVRTPEQNGTAERTIRTILDMARTILIDAKLPQNFWAEAVATATYIKNRCVSKKLNDKTPEEIWSGKVPTASHFRAFGSLAYAWIPKELRNKFDSKVTPSIFVGYYEDKLAYRLYDPKRNKFFASKKPIFLENKIGWFELNEATKEEKVEQNYAFLKDTFRRQERISEQSQIEDQNQSFGGRNNEETENNQEEENSEETENNQVEENNEVTENNQEENGSGESRNNLRRSSRSKKVPQRLEINPKLKKYCCEVTNNVQEPNGYEEAITSDYKDEWKKAMDQEMMSQETMKTWEIVKRTGQMKVLNSKWVYKVKKQLNSESKFKARLVAVGYPQKKRKKKEYNNEV